MDDFIRLCKTRIDNDDLIGLQEVYQEHIDEPYA